MLGGTFSDVATRLFSARGIIRSLLMLQFPISYLVSLLPLFSICDLDKIGAASWKKSCYKHIRTPKVRALCCSLAKLGQEETSAKDLDMWPC